MFVEAKGRAGGFFSQRVGVKEEIFIIHIFWILLQGRGDLQLSPKEGDRDEAGVLSHPQNFPQQLLRARLCPLGLIRPMPNSQPVSEGLGHTYQSL